MRFFLILMLLQPALARAESVVRNPVEFVRKRLLDLRVGPGYLAYENIRVHGQDVTGTQKGAVPMYDFRIGPVYLSNIFDQAGFTLGKGPRVGLLFSYTGDHYETPALAKREKSLFGGGFIGFDRLTLFAYTDLLNKKAGTIYTVHFAPTLFKVGKASEMFLVLDLERMDRLYVDYYFGIRAWEATNILTTYDGRATTNFSGTFLYLWNISKAFQFLVWGGEKQYGPGVTNSPTVALKHAYRTGVGLLVRVF